MTKTIHQAHIRRFECAVGFEYLREKDVASPCAYELLYKFILADEGGGSYRIDFAGRPFPISINEQKYERTLLNCKR